MYFAPEIISGLYEQHNAANTTKSDVWSFGLMIIELINASKLWTNHLKNAQQTFSRLSPLFAIDLTQSMEHNNNIDHNNNINNNIYEKKLTEEEIQKREILLNSQSNLSKNRIQSEFMSGNHWKFISKNLIDVIENCLQFNPIERSSVSELLNHSYFSDLLKNFRSQFLWTKKPFFRSSLLPDLSLDTFPFDVYNNNENNENNNENNNNNNINNNNNNNNTANGTNNNNLNSISNNNLNMTTPNNNNNNNNNINNINNNSNLIRSNSQTKINGEINKQMSSPNLRGNSNTNLLNNNNNDQSVNINKDLNYAEIYNFWKINGGNLLHICKDLEESPSSLRLPCLIRSSYSSSTFVLFIYYLLLIIYLIIYYYY